MYTNQKINQNALRCYMYLTQYIIIDEISEHDREDIYLDKISKTHQICGSVVSVFNKAFTLYHNEILKRFDRYNKDYKIFLLMIFYVIFQFYR